MISVQLFRITNLRDVDREPRPVYKEDLSEVSSISEKALKGRAIDSSARLVIFESSQLVVPGLTGDSQSWRGYTANEVCRLYL